MLILKKKKKVQECVSCIFYYKLHLGSRMCKVMTMKSNDCHIMFEKLLRMSKGIMQYCTHYIYIHVFEYMIERK